MGEHKRNVRAELASIIAEGMVDRGKLLELGFDALITVFHPDGVTDEQRKQLRRAWFLGCDHLFFAVMSVVSDGPQVTQRDMDRMAGVEDELLQFRREALSQSMSAPDLKQ